MKAAGRRPREDRLSKLNDAMLERILSFLPTKEAARTAALSSRWRDAFGGVDAVSLEEPESPIPDYEEHGCGCPGCTFGVAEDPHPTPPFTTTVTTALLARHRAPGAPPPPLRSLRVVLDSYHRQDVSTVDNWVSYGLKHAAPTPAGLELDLRLHLHRVPICVRPYTLRVAGTHKRRRSTYAAEEEELNRRLRISGFDDDSEPDSEVSDDDSDHQRRMSMSRQYTAPARLFSCAALRSLSIGPCRLSPPSAVSLPSLQTLLLVRVSDQERSVQKLLDACPSLADLTLEACGTVTALYLTGNQRLRSLTLRCCHRLDYIVVDDRLHSLEYRGTVPDTSLLAFRRGRGPNFRSCKIDICGEEVTSAKELAKLGKFLQLLLVSTKHLHLQSARLGFGVEHDALATSLPEFTRLLHLELTGRLPHGDGDAAVAAMSRILWHAPSLEVITLAFLTGPTDDESCERDSLEDWKDGELTKANQLRYNEHEVIPSAPAVNIPCLKKRVREINLVHYHGGRAQRTLANFLLCNAPVLKTLYCGFARGPLSIQNKLRDEIQGWAMNRPENSIFD